MEELYTYEQVRAYAVIGAYSLLNSGKYSKKRLCEFDECIMQPLGIICEKEKVIKYSNELKRLEQKK